LVELRNALQRRASQRPGVTGDAALSGALWARHATIEGGD
jgi:hypothetical protein